MSSSTVYLTSLRKNPGGSGLTSESWCLWLESSGITICLWGRLETMAPEGPGGAVFWYWRLTTEFIPCELGAKCLCSPGAVCPHGLVTALASHSSVIWGHVAGKELVTAKTKKCDSSEPLFPFLPPLSMSRVRSGTPSTHWSSLATCRLGPNWVKWIW